MLLALLLFMFTLTPMQAKAGVSETLLDHSTLEGGDWYNAERDVVAEEGKLIFPESSTEYTRFITKTPAKLNEDFDSLVEMSATVKFNQLPKNKSFVFAFGLSNIESVLGEANNVEVTFTNNGGIKLGIIAYDENGTKKTVCSPKSCGLSMKKDAKVSVNIKTDKTITVSVNGNKFYSDKLPVTGEGRVGFLQTGSCNVEISNLEVVHFDYARPENPNVFEDFEKGAMDVSKLSAYVIDMHTIFPRGQVVEEYKGNQVLMFRNLVTAYIGTLYKYSNFEITFDVPYIHSQTEYNEDGSVKKPGQTSFLIDFGSEQADWKEYGWTSAAEAVVFSQNAIYSYNKPQELRGEITTDYFSQPDRGFSVKLSAVDGVVTAGMKWMDESEYQTILTYKLTRGMPEGYVHIWATDCGQFAIDNLKVENLDENPNLIETEFQSGKWEEAKDAGYIPAERVYQQVKDDKEGRLGYFLIPMIAAGVGIVAVVATGIVVTCKKNKKGRMTTDEK